ncbi:hypothetical protein [Marinimicrobium sp. LS-A18]|uniref:hypothetical protein n=1 Tax=Marinimicrobium sp. LS-A18 TaxID=1381596 RepID=UPI000466AD48|nr:hypothetical protein [Marinimicrobium sp. LS-A18]
MDTDVFTLNELSDEKLDQLLADRKSFTIIQIKSMTRAAEKVETEIERRKMRCRVYTKGRAASVGAAAIPVSPTVFGGLLSAAAIGVHNLATFNPDYELAKNFVSSSLEVNCKKD